MSFATTPRSGRGHDEEGGDGRQATDTLIGVSSTTHAPRPRYGIGDGPHLARDAISTTPTTPAPGGARGEARRILIVEDEERIASFVEKGLRANGFATTVVGHGIRALALTSDHSFDLVILDLGLPDLDGLEVLRLVRERGSDVPVVIVTARDGAQAIVAGLEGGADDYVTKPFRFEELLARVRLRLRDNRPG